MGASNDGSEDVDQFLARIASLSKKDTTQDAEQSRRTEEQMMQARRERQARRAERARSISPSKTGPAAPLSSSPVRATHEASIDPPISLRPLSRSQTPGNSRQNSPTRTSSTRPLSALNLSQGRQLPQPPQDSQDSRPQTPTSAGLSRSGTLSWQQRPLSRGIGSGFGSIRSRPLSGARALPREQAESPKEDVTAVEEPLSRSDIAASLGSRDPAWFRQTQDRGSGSAAYRRSDHNEVASDMPPPQAQRLPGMANTDSLRDPINLHPTPQLEPLAIGRAVRPESPQRHTASAYVSNEEPSQNTRQSGEQPDYPTNKFPRESDVDLGRSPSVLAGRPPSPTKGLGGFVQSAMMRRSDSVSKRWSVQANAGLKRGDSIASNRPNFNLPTAPIPSLGHARTLSRDPASRDGTASPQNGSRPSSSHAASNDHHPTIQNLQIATSAQDLRPKDESPAKQPSIDDDPDEEPVLSRSPSKTLDPRRWSPTKASWLESALSKPESPRSSPTKEEPPPWKLNMQRSKSNKDLSQSPIRHIPHEPVSTPSLLRSPPPTVKAKPIEMAKSHEPVTYKSLNTAAPGKPVAVVNELPESRQADVNDTVQEPSSSVPRGVSSPPTTPSKGRKPQDEGNSRLSESAASPKPGTDRKPPITKPKPDTPPKTDFRANLKSRSVPTTKASDEPEFKAVFGKLKKAQTQNYVAPDLLKDNITRGKAALALTSGPQARKRVDEFKESILAKKEEMKAGVGSVHNKDDSENATAHKPEPEVPEALRRRNTLHKSKASEDKQTPPGAKDDGPRSPPHVQTKTKPTWSSKKDSAPSREPVQESKSWKPEPQKLNANVETDHKPDKIAPKPNLVEPATQTRSQTQKPSEVVSKPAQLTTLLKDSPAVKAPDTSGSSPIPRHEISSRAAASVPPPAEKKPIGAPTGLAARLNPALADLIARGGSPKPSTSDDAPQMSMDGSTSQAKGDSATLEHVTKGRAKGPKRKAPKNAAVEEEPKIQQIGIESDKKTMDLTTVAKVRDNAFTRGESQSSPRPLPAGQQNDRGQHHPTPKSQPVAVSTGETPKLHAVSPTTSTVDATAKGLGVPLEKTRSPPVVVAKSSELRRVSGQSPPPLEQADTLAKKPEIIPAKPSTKKPFAIATDKTSENPLATKAILPKRDLPTSTGGNLPLTPSRSKLNSSWRSKPSDEDAGTVSGKAVPAGLGLDLARNKAVVTAQEPTPPPEKSFDLPRSPKKTSMPITSLKQALSTQFSSMPRTSDKSDFDTEAILSIKPSVPAPIRTISTQIWEVTSDGKKSVVAQQQEHILFEDTLYLVLHNFEITATSKKNTACYLWHGDLVSASIVEDVQLFCRKTARENNNAKLEVIKQGKEPSNFFAALGGIVITRRSKSSSASALYMLCGRRHLGHVTFDEVDFSPANLCSGFPYLISAKFGKLYLWKGSGSGADEIGAARLIGMDLGLTGEIEEVSEGKESNAFWECFPSCLNAARAKAQFVASDIWAMRSMDEKRGFPCRLYRLEAERPKSSGVGVVGSLWGLRASSPAKESGKNKMTLVEIEPFVQADLDESGAGSVHVLDAWASIYVIPSPTSKPSDFATALHIAQEMAVLTPSMQDRAILPSCEVVLSDASVADKSALPREIRAAFRRYVAWGGAQEAGVWEVSEVLAMLD